MSLSTTILVDLPDGAEWPSLDGHDAIPMQTHAWMSARAAALVGPGPRHVAASDAQGLQALAPLVRVGHWLRELPVMFEPSDFVWSTPEALQALADTLAGLGLPLYLERLPAASPTLAAVRAAFARRGIVLVRPAMPTPFIPLEGRDVEASFNSRRRSDFRRMERRAAEYGVVTYELHSPGVGSQLDDLIDEAYGIETASWKYAARTALTADDAQGTFFERFMHTAARDGNLRIAFLRIDGRPVAMQIASEWRQRFWLFKMSYDRAFAHCSPGQLLLRHTLRHAVARGLRSYEFMGIMDDWTRLWTRDAHQYVQVRAIPFSAAALKMIAGSTLRAVYRRLRRIVR